jgi:hypothetical protein
MEDLDFILCSIENHGRILSGGIIEIKFAFEEDPWSFISE